MEIYTADMIDVAKDHAEKIRQQLVSKEKEASYVIEDECCNLQKELRTMIYKRLSIEFENLARKVDNGDPVDLKNDLFKIINDL